VLDSHKIDEQDCRNRRLCLCYEYTICPCRIEASGISLLVDQAQTQRDRILHTPDLDHVRAILDTNGNVEDESNGSDSRSEK
jgi:hypothetical protein